jgi:CRP-like cAMP-binding protein
MERNLFEDLTASQRGTVVRACVVRRFARRQTIFHRGDPNDGLYIVRSGRIAIRMSTPEGEVASLVVIGPGHSVGEQSLLIDGGRRSATAVALDPVEALFLSRSRFLEVRAADSTIDEVIIRLLASRVLRLTDQLVEALYVPASTRVLRRVAEAAEMYGDGSIPLTQEEVASMAGSTRHTANRVLRAAAQCGVLELSRGRIRVLDLATLRELAS